MHQNLRITQKDCYIILQMIKYLLTLLLLVNLFAVDIKINNLTLIDQEPQLLATVANGQKFLIGSLDDPEKNYLYIANLKGTPQQMGEAYGQLFKSELKDIVKIFYDYYLDQLEDLLIDKAKMPKFVAHQLRQGVYGFGRRVLDLNIMITKKYTNKRYYEEINGIGKGSGINPKEFARINLVPELIKAACTVAGVWGTASAGGKTLHVRALDWDYKNPISKLPIVTVYHPSNQKWNTHANFAWVGFVGSMTGMSTKVTLGEKVWLPPSGSVQMTRYGNPWTYVFRDVLYEANNLSQALQILSTTHRTCAIHIGLGSKDDKSFRMLEYAQKVVNVYDDKNYTHYGANHPKVQGIAYFDKHVQPSGDKTVGELLTSPKYLGNWTLDSLWRTIGVTHETGDTKLVVFSLEDQEVYISYSEFNGTKKAFERRPIYLDMKKLFAPF